MGPVFRAYDPERDRLVAIKLFRLDIAPDRVHRVVAELQKLIAAELTHPAIATPISTGIDGADAYLVMEYVAAESLDTAVRETGPAPPADALRVAAQLAGALDFAAGVHVGHGVLHPRDILLSSDETRLTGLGVATALERIGIATPLRRPYAAPERIAGAPWDRRADVFSLAALMHEMLWARRPAATGVEAAASLTEVAGCDLDRLRAVFARALAENPEDRFPVALEFAGALKGACVSLQSPVASHQSEVVRQQSQQPIFPLELEMAAQDAGSDDFELRPSTRSARSGSTVSIVEPSTGLGRPDLAGDRCAEAERYAVVESAAAIVEPVSSGVQPAAAGVLLAKEREPISVLERSRSAIWPLALALVVGVALGFAVGYGVGTNARAAAAVETTSATPPAQGPATVPGREWTEGAVTEPTEVRPSTGSERPALVGGSTALTVDPELAERVEGRLQPDANPATPARNGRLVVRTTPSGARVFVNGRESGRTPVTVGNLARGTHRVRIVRDGYAAAERRVAITRARPTRTMALRLAPVPSAARPTAPAPSTPGTIGGYTGALSVESRPAGARVYVDGRLVGSTPLSLPEVAAGEHAVRIERDGYRPWSASVRVVADQRNRVTASLER